MEWEMSSIAHVNRSPISTIKNGNYQGSYEANECLNKQTGVK